MLLYFYIFNQSVLKTAELSHEIPWYSTGQLIFPTLFKINVDRYSNYLCRVILSVKKKLISTGALAEKVLKNQAYLCTIHQKCYKKWELKMLNIKNTKKQSS